MALTPPAGSILLSNSVTFVANKSKPFGATAEPMNLITLTTDLGLRDHYVAVLKGKILRHFEDLQFMDISHEVEPFNVQQGAHLLRAGWRHFR